MVYWREIHGEAGLFVCCGVLCCMLCGWGSECNKRGCNHGGLWFNCKETLNDIDYKLHQLKCKTKKRLGRRERKLRRLVKRLHRKQDGQGLDQERILQAIYSTAREIVELRATYFAACELKVRIEACRTKKIPAMKCLVELTQEILDLSYGMDQALHSPSINTSTSYLVSQCLKRDKTGETLVLRPHDEPTNNPYLVLGRGAVDRSGGEGAEVARLLEEMGLADGFLRQLQHPKIGF